MDYREWLTFAEQKLLENSGANPYLNAKFDANLLLQAVTKRSKSAIFAFCKPYFLKASLQN